MTHPSVHARTQPDKIAYQMAGTGKSITYRLRLSVLEDALLAFADSFGLGFSIPPAPESPTEEGAK